MFGPEAKFRAWLVQDGDFLYVDRNGNGDLTEEGERVAKKQGDAGNRQWEVGDLTDGGLKHTIRFVMEMTVNEGSVGNARNSPGSRGSMTVRSTPGSAFAPSGPPATTGRCRGTSTTSSTATARASLRSPTGRRTPR